ncbi:hypothetical protein N7452_008258, partial [Penicillium brevicompactum]
RPVNCRHYDLQFSYNGHVRVQNAQPLNVQMYGKAHNKASCLKASRAMIQLPSCWVKWVRGLYYVDFVFTKLIDMIGCIHQERKKEKEVNSTVYGMGYSGSTWHFLQIDHSSKWSERPVLAHEGALQLPFAILVWMLRKAAAISPPHSKETSAETYSEEGSGDMEIDVIAGWANVNARC